MLVRLGRSRRRRDERSGDQGIPPAISAASSLQEHEHAWRLTSVEFEEGGQVRRFECEECAEVHFD